MCKTTETDTHEFFKVNEIVKKYSFKMSNLIAILQDIQKEYRYLPEEILTYVATIMDIPLSHIYGVATFYSQFSLAPKGKYEIRICDGTACHVRGSSLLLTALRKKLALTESKTTTDDMLFSLETVSCLGACGLAPVVVINEKVYPQMTPEKINKVIDDIQGKNKEQQ
jgi:NADH-quinone oxidoreductase subunit E